MRIYIYTYASHIIIITLFEKVLMFQESRWPLLRVQFILYAYLKVIAGF